MRLNFILEKVQATSMITEASRIQSLDESCDEIVIVSSSAPGLFSRCLLNVPLRRARHDNPGPAEGLVGGSVEEQLAC
jgi:hypothetical protein